ncbi:hypothetical protein X949_4257 [Burkholderia pseudomallei MSHR5609]|nr:hypothetical protein X949_4257 [Burkholderia pseudomallei MSHR5609]
MLASSSPWSATLLCACAAAVVVAPGTAAHAAPMTCRSVLEAWNGSVVKERDDCRARPAADARDGSPVAGRAGKARGSIARPGLSIADDGMANHAGPIRRMADAGRRRADAIRSAAWWHARRAGGGSARRETDLAEFRFGQHAHDRRHRVRYGGARQFELQARLPGLVVDDRGVDVERGAEHLMQQAPHMRQIAGADAYRHQHARVRPLRSHANRRRSVANARVRCMQGRCGDRLGMETQRLHMRIFRAAMRPGPRRFRLEHDGHSRKRREDSVYRVPRSTKKSRKPRGVHGAGCVPRGWACGGAACR